MVKQSLINDVSYSSLRVASINALNNPEGFVDCRLPGLLEELSTVKADVVMVQEALSSQKDLVREGMLSLGYVSSFYTEPTAHSQSPERLSGTAVFCKFNDVRFSTFNFSDPYGTGFDERFTNSSVASFEFEGLNTHFISSHFAWGGGNERYRLAQAKQMTELAAKFRDEDPNSIVVMGGDLNATEASASIRYLKGLDAGIDDDFEGRDLWIDAWELAGNEENYVTSHGSDYWGSRTAKGVGIQAPFLIPKRRIDYLMVFGWAYGRHGCPVSFGRFADRVTGDEREVSDHYGIYSDLAFFTSN